MSKKILNASEMGKIGGVRVHKMYGSEHMSQIAKKGREKVRKESPDLYKKWSQAGIHAREVKKQVWIQQQLGEEALNLLTGS